MKFIADANIPRTLVYRLSESGFDIVSILDFIPANASDDEVYAESLRQRRTIISRDKHFGNILLYPLNAHYGVIVLRTKGLNTDGMTEALTNFLRETAEFEFKGTLHILENNKFRRRSN